MKRNKATHTKSRHTPLRSHLRNAFHLSARTKRPRDTRHVDLSTSSARIVGALGVCTFLVLGAAGVWLLVDPSLSTDHDMLQELFRNEGHIRGQNRTTGFVVSLFFTLTALTSVGVFAAWFPSRMVARDITEVARAVHAMAEAQRSARPIPVRSLDELGDLLRRFEVLRRHVHANLEEHRIARAQAEEADLQNTEFLTAIRHELRNPLNAILGFADILTSEIDGQLSPGQRENVETIRSAGEHLMSLFNDVLDLSAASIGRLSVEAASFDLMRVVRDTCQAFRGQLRGRPVTLSVIAEDSTLLVVGDAKRTKQILDNLVANAVKFTEKGSIRVMVRRDATNAWVDVSDTGIGIPPGQIARIFDEFHQADTRHSSSGAGLGLAISQRLAELQHGMIHVRSEVGAGSTFSLRLPAVGMHAPGSPSFPTSDATPASSAIEPTKGHGASTPRTVEHPAVERDPTDKHARDPSLPSISRHCISGSIPAPSPRDPS